MVILRKFTFLALIKVMHPEVADENKDKNAVGRQNARYENNLERDTSNEDP